MCYQCVERFGNIEKLPVWEELNVESERNSSYELTPDGISAVGPSNHHSHSSRNASDGHHHHDISDIEHGPAAQRLKPDGNGAYVPYEPQRIRFEARFQAVDFGGYDDLLDAARTVLEKERAIKNISGEPTEAGARPGAGYGMSHGDYERALMVVEANYDHRVYRALAEAIREKGTDVDILTVGSPTGELDPWEDELPGIREGKVKGHPLLRTTGVRWWEDYAEESDEYDLLIYGVGGPPRRLEDTDYERIPWRNEVDLVSPGTFFPTPVWNLINERTAELIWEAERVHLTDPEGTDIEFTNYYHQHTPRMSPGHIFGHPTYLLPEINTTGVIAGTLNHAGAYPRIEVEVKNAKVVDVRGGGQYGQLWREMLDATEGIQYPGLPGPGLFWLFEVAIGTNPKVSRPTVEDVTRVQFPEMDRRRSGVIHCGFGCYYDVEPWAAEIRNVPWGHVHVHLNFPTYEATMPDGETLTLIEDGHLTVLDDPEVREIASEYGDPDDILSEDWIPAVPGISVEGTYNEYAKDPVQWIQRQMTTRKA